MWRDSNPSGKVDSAAAMGVSVELPQNLKKRKHMIQLFLTTKRIGNILFGVCRERGSNLCMCWGMERHSHTCMQCVWSPGISFGFHFSGAIHCFWRQGHSLGPKGSWIQLGCPASSPRDSKHAPACQNFPIRTELRSSCFTQQILYKHHYLLGFQNPTLRRFCTAVFKAALWKQ